MNRLLEFMAIMWPMAGLLSCENPDSLKSEPGVVRIIASLAGNEPQARSVLDGTRIFEDMVKSMTVAAFDNETGFLVDCMHESAGELDLALPKDRTYRIFLMANMGDQTGHIPYSMEDMHLFSYDMGSYSLLKTEGLPMSCDTVTVWKRDMVLSLRRLMAKLVIRVDKNDIADMGGGGEEAFMNQKVAVGRVARILYPFAPRGSAARNVADIFNDDSIEFESFTDAIANNSEELVLYVPENMQGTKLSGNAVPGDKSESNPELAGAELCTFVSLEGYKNGETDGVYGNLEYKFFPGADNKSNFDLAGGCRYDITLKLTWNGMYSEEDWKVERSGWTDNRRMSVSLSPESGYASGISVELARGSSVVPVYISYSPQGYGYEEEGFYHHDKGWMFCLRDLSGEDVPPQAGDGEFTGDKMNTGFIEHTSLWTMHYVTIPLTTESGYTNGIGYFTCDGRIEAVMEITVVEPRIDFMPSSMSFLYCESGPESGRMIEIGPMSPVRPCNIEVYTDDDSLITVGPLDSETGRVHVYWNDENTSSEPRTAKVILHSESCHVTAVCMLTQNKRPALDVGPEEDAGTGDIEY